jgi:hypothetical protein
MHMDCDKKYPLEKKENVKIIYISEKWAVMMQTGMDSKAKR